MEHKFDFSVLEYKKPSPVPFFNICRIENLKFGKYQVTIGGKGINYIFFILILINLTHIIEFPIIYCFLPHIFTYLVGGIVFFIFVMVNE